MNIEVLKEQKIPQTKISQLKKAGIEQLEDLMYYYPKKYIDRSSFTGIQPDGESIFLFQCDSVHMHNNRAMLVEAIGTLAGSAMQVRILWFNQSFLYSTVESTIGQLVLVAGIVKYMPAEPMFNKPERLEVAAPAVYDPAGADALKIYPSYKKVPGMAEDYLVKLIRIACDILGPAEETIPDAIISRHGLMSHADMVMNLHDPANPNALNEALRRKRWDDLLYFALRIEMNNRKVPRGSVYNLTSLSEMNKVRDALPFQLTDDQAKALAGAIDYIRTGRRLNALVQGDVGCGKTIVALLLMIAFATNGYQAVLMAPTQILARQHYEKLCQICDPLNIPVAFVGGGKLRKKEQDALEANLANGEYRLVVGTQALLEGKYQFRNLALVVEDEEHKYGVLQRAALTEKAAGGTHTVTIKFLGDKDHKPSEATVTVVVDKAPCSIDFDSQVVVYGTDYDFTLVKNPADVETVNFMVGLDLLDVDGKTVTPYVHVVLPGWLGEILDGATTVWETWEGDVSRNHYSPGAVCQWLFDTVGGIRPDGENRFVVKPVPGGSLTFAKTSYKSHYGSVESSWEKNGPETVFTVTVPANTTARLMLPDGSSWVLNAGTHTYTV